MTGGQWVVLGSSTAAGVGASHGQGWVSRLSAAAQPRGVVIANLARSGLLSTQALPTDTTVPPGEPPPDPAANITAALALKPTLVLLAFPTNDTVTGMSAAQTLAAWTTIAATARGAGSATLVLSTQPRAGLSAVQRATQAQIDLGAAQVFGACFVAVHDALAGPDGSIDPRYAAGDGTHLNDEGHAVVLGKVEAAISSGGCLASKH